MKVLIACEESQTITAKYRENGIEAYSCDLKPAKINSDWHFQKDVFEVINLGWDLMIAHPPCTYLSFVGNVWLNIDKYGEKAIQRHKLRDEAMKFFMDLYNCNIPRIAIENPRGYPMQVFRKPDQIIHPYYFGDEHKKTTCLWLKNLPKLEYSLTDNLFFKKTATKEPEPIYIQKNGKKCYFTDAMSPSKDRAEKRSKTFDGIASAIVNQWIFNCT